MVESAGIQSKIEQLKQNAINLERQGLQLDHEVEINLLEIARLQAVERQQQQELKIT